MIPMPFAFLLLLAQKPAVPPPLPPLPPYDSAWTREAWTADETPYLRVRKEVEAYTLGRRVSRTKTDLVAQTARMLASRKNAPKDPVALYRAAYYAYMLAGLDYSPEAQALLKGIWIDMGAIPSPHSREYDRLRMLREGFLNEVFLDLGERLYKGDPDDVELALKLAWTQSMYRPGSPKRAVEIADRLLKTGDPKRYPAIYYAYGLAHHVIYSSEPTHKNVDQATWGYQQYLAAGPPWRRRVSEVTVLLESVNKYLKDSSEHTP